MKGNNVFHKMGYTYSNKFLMDSISKFLDEIMHIMALSVIYKSYNAVKHQNSILGLNEVSFTYSVFGYNAYHIVQLQAHTRTRHLTPM